MGVYNDIEGLGKTIDGEKVERSTSNLPQTATGNLFTISGGRVAIKKIIGEVTTVIQTQACNLKLTHDPDVGAAADICAVLDISAKAVGTQFGITGTVANALIGASHAYLEGQAKELILPAGVLTWITSASNTGQVKWTIFYTPIDQGARIEAV